MGLAFLSIANRSGDAADYERAAASFGDAADVFEQVGHWGAADARRNAEEATRRMAAAA